MCADREPRTRRVDGIRPGKAGSRQTVMVAGSEKDIESGRVFAKGEVRGKCEPG
jgi:hypothetical protein